MDWAPVCLEVCLSTVEAAEVVGVTPGAIRKWAYRGHLPVGGLDERGRPTYRWIDVVKAERATRVRARRKYPVVVESAA